MYIFNKPQNLFDFYHFHNNLDSSIISNIFEIVSQLNYEEGKVKMTNNEKNRKSQVKWIYHSKETSDLFSFLSTLINQANTNHFNFDIVDAIEALQYTEYNSLEYGKYNWHVDAILPTDPPHRKLSLTIQLSDPSEYEGGDLEIYYPHPEKGKILKVPKEKGKIVVFPSYMWHRVTPVTKGVRKSLVWWVGGTPFR